MLTLVVMIVTTPFTLKGTRSMIQMQRLQPEMKRLQLKYKDDRQKLNEELMAFYKENQINPLGGLPAADPPGAGVHPAVPGDPGPHPAWVPTAPSTRSTSTPRRRCSRASIGAKEMIGLRRQPRRERQQGAGARASCTGSPTSAMVAIVAVSSYYQQKQIQGRNPDAEIPPQQKMLMRLMPAMFVFFAFVSPAALVVYFVTSNLYRIGMQHYITRTLYHGEDSPGRTGAARPPSRPRSSRRPAAART